MPKYRVIAGSHSHSEFTSGPKAGKPRIHRQGMVFEHTNHRLHMIHKNKYEPMPQDAEVTPEWRLELDLERMTREQLADYASEANIYLGAAKSERDILAIVLKELEKRDHEKKEAARQEHKKPVTAGGKS